MDNEPDWKLNLRYGKLTTPFTHFTAIGDGVVTKELEGFSFPPGPAVMSMKMWATDADESADMLRVIGQQIGFEVKGKIEIYSTDPEEPPSENPFGYDVNFVPYSDSDS